MTLLNNTTKLVWTTLLNSSSSISDSGSDSSNGNSSSSGLNGDEAEESDPFLNWDDDIIAILSVILIQLPTLYYIHYNFWNLRYCQKPLPYTSNSTTTTGGSSSSSASGSSATNNRSSSNTTTSNPRSSAHVYNNRHHPAYRSTSRISLYTLTFFLTSVFSCLFQAMDKVFYSQINPNISDNMAFVYNIMWVMSRIFFYLVIIHRLWLALLHSAYQYPKKIYTTLYIIVFIQFVLGVIDIIVDFIIKTDDSLIYGRTTATLFVIIELVLNIFLMFLFAKALMRALVVCNQQMTPRRPAVLSLMPIKGNKTNNNDDNNNDNDDNNDNNGNNDNNNKNNKNNKNKIHGKSKNKNRHRLNTYAKDFLRVITKTTLLASIALISDGIFGLSWIYAEWTNFQYYSFGILVYYYNVDTVINAFCIILCYSFANVYYRMFCECKCDNNNNNNNNNNNRNHNNENVNEPCSPHRCCARVFEWIAIKMYVDTTLDYNEEDITINVPDNSYKLKKSKKESFMMALEGEDYQYVQLDEKESQKKTNK